MQQVSLRRNPGASLGWVATVILVVVFLVASTAPAAAQTRALDCNSELSIDLPATITPGATFPVTLTVTSGLATDAMNDNVEQRFAQIDFFPSCTATGPCTPDATLPVSFDALVSNTCPGLPSPPPTAGALMVTATPQGGGTQIDLTFTNGIGGSEPTIGGDANALTLPPAGPGMPPPNTIDCQIVFDVMVDPMFVGTTDMEARATGICNPGVDDLASSAEATANVVVNPVPTLGEFALAALALLLVLGSWLALRRRTATG